MTPSRRGFLTGMLGLVAAPAIVRVASLMPVKALPGAGGINGLLPYVDNALDIGSSGALRPVVIYRQEFIRAFDMRVQEVTQQLIKRPDGQVGVEMRFANGKVDFIPMA